MANRRSKTHALVTAVLVATVVLCLWIAFIWGHSMMPGDVSSDESGFVARILAPLMARLGITDARRRTYVVRKCAHFTEYAILAMMSRHFVRVRGLSRRRSALVLLALLVITPLIDEGIQFFVPGRSCALKDVAIDVSGGVCGHILYQSAIMLTEGKRRLRATIDSGIHQ